MENAIEVARWVKSLNGKQTKCFESDWKPSHVEFEEVVAESAREVIDESVRIVKEGSGKTVVFVHSKKSGREIVKRLKKVNIRSAFHNASVSKAARKKIEDQFNSGGLDVLVSTSTLGAGVNLAV